MQFTNRFGAVLCAGALCCAAVSASPITNLNQLPGSALGNFAVVASGTSNSLQLTSDTFINGNVAIGTGETVGGSGVSINGYLDNANASASNISGTTASGGIYSNVSGTQGTLATNAISDAASLFSLYTAATGLALTTGTINVSSNPGTLYSGQTNEFVYTLQTNALGGTANLAITATAGQYVIVNVIDTNGGNANFQLGNVSLSGGITSDHVLIDFDSASGQLFGKNGTTINAIIDAGVGTVGYDAGTVDGRFICTTGSGNCSIVSNATVTAGVNSIVATPEPASLSLMLGAGLMLVGMVRRSRKA